MRVLIAEDEPRIAGAVARGLRREGMAVDIAADGAAALFKARVVPYDVVVLDPGFSGAVPRSPPPPRARPRPLPPVLEAADVVLDPARRSATRAGRPLELTPKEFAVLEVLLSAQGDVVTPDELAERAWDDQLDPLSNTVRMTVMTLRRKLGDPPLVETVRGSGYRV